MAIKNDYFYQYSDEFVSFAFSGIFQKTNVTNWGGGGLRFVTRATIGGRGSRNRVKLRT